jgi:hypothetical protein
MPKGRYKELRTSWLTKPSSELWDKMKLPHLRQLCFCSMLQKSTRPIAFNWDFFYLWIQNNTIYM